MPLLYTVRKSSFFFKLEKIIENYEKIELYFDNDEAGNRATNEVKQLNPHVEDYRTLYQNYKDLNDFIMSKISLLWY